ncbi:MAG: antitoxin [Devosia sp.]
MQRAKVFWNGRSQAVRLPKEFRFEGDEVAIRREGDLVILEPVTPDEDEWAWLNRITGPLDEDFLRAIDEELPMQERPELDDLFK